MSITSGFFNAKKNESNQPDRAYDAEDMSRLFDGLIKDGVYEHIGDRFLVTPLAGSRRVYVGSGRAWFDGTWTYNDEAIIVPPISEPEIENAPNLGGLNRIDSIVLRVDKTDTIRSNSIVLKSGTLASRPTPPELRKDALVKEYRLANITFTGGNSVTEISSTMISNCVGEEETPLATGILQSIDISAEKAEIANEFETWFAETKALWEAEFNKYPFLRIIEE